MIRSQHGVEGELTTRRGGLALLIILAGWLLAFPANAAAGSPLAGKLINLQGNVTVAAAGSQNWQKAELSQDLLVGDAIQTGPDSRAAILCVDESQIKLNENTRLVLKNVAPSPRLGLAAVQPAKAGEPASTRFPRGRSGCAIIKKISRLGWKPPRLLRPYAAPSLTCGLTGTAPAT